jgi:alpha-1,3-rhamnosyltransferase
MKNSHPLITVIIPSFNHEKYIKEAIQSIINQTYNNLELIIIDDGSQDKSIERVNELKEICEKRFAKFIFIAKKNEGIIKTLNNSFRYANGEYILMIASDDRAKENTIKTLYEFLSQNSDYALAVGDNHIIDQEGQKCYWDSNRNNVYNEEDSTYKTFGDFLKRNRKDVDFNSEQFGSYKSLLKGNYIPNGFLIKKSVIDQIGGYSENALLEDLYLVMQISKISKMKYLDLPLFCYRWHNNNTVKESEKMVLYTLKTLENEWNYNTLHKFTLEYLYLIELRISLAVKRIKKIIRQFRMFGI